MLELRLEQAQHLLNLLDKGELSEEQFFDFSGEEQYDY